MIDGGTERRFLVIETEKSIQVFVMAPTNQPLPPRKFLYGIDKPLPDVVNQAYQMVTRKEPL